MHKIDLKHTNSTLQKKLEQLYALGHSAATGSNIKNDIRPEYLDLLKKFGNPHLKLPPTIIHLAGTNGKGSTIAFLKAILEEQSYTRVHTYTSPHLMDFNERINICGQPIENEKLETLIDQALEYSHGQSLSFFELTTAIALAAFAEEPAHVLLLETGMGGRLDCTNVIPAPTASVIAQIGYDHQQYLGTTIEEITREKAGIMKQGSLCVIGKQTHDEALQILRDHAEKTNLPFFTCGKTWEINPSDLEKEPDSLKDQGQSFTVSYNGKARRYPTPNLTGSHQINNAALAIATIKTLKDSLFVSEENIRNGLKKATWPGRLQNITNDMALGSDAEIWLDGGHNADAGEALAEQIKIWKQQDDKPLHIICGMMQGKDASGFLNHLIPHAYSVNIVPIPGEKHCLTAQDIRARIGEIRPIDEYNSAQDALNALTSATPNARFLICGSLYLAGDILRELKHNKHHEPELTHAPHNNPFS